MVRRMKMKCHSEKKTAFEPMPYEVELRLAEPKKFRGGEIVRVTISSDRPNVFYEVGKTYTVDIKSSE